MRKKISLVLLLIVGIFTITGCENNSKNEKEKIESVKDIEINGQKIVLNKNGNIDSLNYKYSDKFIVDELNNRIMYAIGEEPPYKLFVQVMCLDNYTMKQALDELNYTDKYTVPYNKVEWTRITARDEGLQMTLNYYLYEYNNKLFSVAFSGENNGADFEKYFLSNISFK